MIRVGITGQPGFVGSHLYNYLGLQKDIERIPCDDAFFQDETALRNFVRQCDVIVHLAAMNRHPDMQVIYDTNVRLVQRLIAVMEAENVTPHVLFSSSTQEDKDNLYGASKRDGRRLLDEWAARCGGKFTGLVIPNVFGPFGRPNYNSMVATFCHKLTHGEPPDVLVDSSVKLIYVGSLCREILSVINGVVTDNPYCIPHDGEKKVTEIISLLTKYKEQYYDLGIIPYITDDFEQSLFNTFVCYIDHQKYYPRQLKLNTDMRGSFVETIKLDHTGGQVSFSTTHPGITRGNHYHTRKFERFAVIKGKARLQLRKIGCNEVLNFDIDADVCPGYVDMPVWYTHNITNTGNETVYTIFWINEFYNAEDHDTYFEFV
jgi:UDP-2-acetamido-2,6-beta-L-arabino-hexul-4-ose reductase